MPKMKTHKGTAKRMKVTARGKVVRPPAGKRHLLSHKTAKRKRRLRQAVPVDETQARRARRLLPYE